MSKPRQHSSGLSDTPNSHTSSKKQNKRSTRQAIKEQTAIELINQGKLIEAESIYKQLIAEGTRNHIVYSNLAELCGMQGKPEERIKLLENALKLKPNYTVAHNNLGNALQEKGDLDAAIISYKTAIQLQQITQ